MTAPVASPPAATEKPPARRLRRWRWLAVLPVAAAFGWWGLPWAVPLPDGLDSPADASPVVTDRHGQPLHHLVLPDFTRRQPVPLEEIPADLIACTLAAEDKRFFRHGGVDLLATARAAKDAVMHRRTVSGASTLTQQLVKLSSPPAPRNLRTKVREALLARRLEMSWSKERILAAYFDRLPYGNHRTGPVEAARFYFGKPMASLSLGECALLAGLPQAPSRLNPLRHPQRALKRRDVVLARLEKSSPSERIGAARKERPRYHRGSNASLAPWLPAAATPAGPVRSTIDAALQADVEKIVREELRKLDGSNVRHAAVVVLDHRTREVLALVSSGDWRDPRGGQINGALTPRSPGSALKPFTWLLAFDRGGLHPASIVADIPTRFRTVEGLDLPENFDRGFRGPVTVREALACSLNVPTMRELEQLGGPRPLHGLLRQLGMDSVGDDPQPFGLGLTLGNAPVRLIDLANAYATLAEGGRHTPWRLWLDDPGTPADGPRLFTGRSSFLIAGILADPEARAPAFGRGGPLELPFPCGAKTGTSSDFRDNWCLGFTADITVGVWAGNFDNSPMKGVSGIAGAGPVFHRVMKRVHRDRPHRWLDRPDGLVDVRVDPITGKVTSTGIPTLVPQDRVPLPASAGDRDEAGRVLLDASYAEWIASPHNRRRGTFALRPELPAETPLRILAPRDGSTYLLDPELPNGGRLHLSTNLPGQAGWSCDTLSVSRGGSESIATLRPGKHVLVATDKRDGRKHEVTIHVAER